MSLPRTVLPLPPERIPTLSTRRLLASRDRLLSLESSPSGSDLEPAEIAAVPAERIAFENDPRWSPLYRAIKNELATREYVP